MSPTMIQKHSDILSDGRDIIVSVADVTAEALTNSELLSKIPFFGSLVKIYDFCNSLSNRILLRKISAVLTSIHEIDPKTISDFLEKSDVSLGENLLVSIDRLDNISKAEMIGKLFKGLILSQISIDDFNRATHAIQNLLSDDIKIITHSPKDLQFAEAFSTAQLYSYGLLELRLEVIHEGGNENYAHGNGKKYTISELGTTVANLIWNSNIEYKSYTRIELYSVLGIE